MNKIIKSLLEIAKKILKNEGFLIPQAFFIKDNEKGMVRISPNFKTAEEKYKSCIAIGLTAKQVGANSIILLNDVASKTYSKENADYVEKNYNTESPLTYPESQRDDGIMIMYMDMKTKKIDAYFQKYKKQGNNIKFYKIKEFPDNEMDGLVPESIFEGYDINLEEPRIIGS